jgi:hypothetical protein
VKAQRISCLNNEKQMGLGSQMYAEDDSKKAISGVGTFADDDLNWLFPQYVPNLKSFICPSTKNTVTELRVSPVPTQLGNDDTGVTYPERLHDAGFFIPNLRDNAAGKNATIGHSYEVAGFLNARGTGGGQGANIRKTQNTVAAYTYKLSNNFPQYQYFNQRGGPSDIWIIYDEDDKDTGGSDPTRKNEDYPDPGDNHGADGENVVFCDGHAEWVTQKNYLRKWFMGTDEYKDPIVP